MPTSEEIRSAMAGLTPEQQLQFMDELEKRQAQTPQAPATPQSVGVDPNLSPMEQLYKSKLGIAEKMPAGSAGMGVMTAATLGLGALPTALPALGALVPRAFGAAEGYRLGKKPAQVVGLPGAAGGVPGAVIGALNPGATITAGVGEMAGNAVGGEGAGIPMALAALWARKKGLGPIIDLLTKMRGAKGAATAGTMAEEVAAARRAAEVAKVLPAEEAAVRAAPKMAEYPFERAAREAKQAATLAKPMPAPRAPEAPYPTGPTEEYKQMIARANAERAARLAEYDAAQAAEREAAAAMPKAMSAEELALRDAAEAQAMADQLKVEQQWLKHQEMLAKKTGLAEAQSARDQIRVEQAYLKAVENARKKAEVARQMGATARSTPAAVPAAPVPAPAPAAPPESPMRPERIQIGAERTGRPLGLTKEEVRRQTGPVLGEALGEASPILPRQAHAAIVEKIKTLPRGPERDAYVALANAKARPQVENIRRTMEQLGFALPVGLAGLLARQE